MFQTDFQNRLNNTVMASNDIMIDDSFDDSGFTFDETELETLLLEHPELASQDEWDVKVDPIPLDEITPGDGYHTLMEYAAPLDLWFASNDAPVILLLERPELASQDEWDVKIDPIPLDEITPDDGYHALVEYAAPLDLWFASNDAPVITISKIQEATLAKEEMPHQEEKNTISRRATNRLKPRATSAKKTVTKRKRKPTTVGCFEVTDLCPQYDVLFGRGGHANHNPGNSFLLDKVKEHRAEYKMLGKRKEGKEKKKIVVQRVAAMVEARGGRFLLREHKDGPWHKATDQEVHEKISHMLRDLLNTTQCFSIR